MAGPSVGFVGSGRVAHIILGGLKRARLMPAQVVASDIDLGVLTRLQAGFPKIRVAHNNNREPASQDMVFLGLHPPVLASALEEIRGCLKPGAVVISLAPKLSRAKLTEGLAGFDRIVRLIPNAACDAGSRNWRAHRLRRTHPKRRRGHHMAHKRDSGTAVELVG
jgi:pyrroline-5-carboxylate reductase